MIELELILKALTSFKVDFVIIGGVAITTHGSAYLTKDLDICYSRANKNLGNIVAALSEFSPKFRGFPVELPFVFDISTLRNGTNFTFITEIGDIDLLGEVAGIGNYDEVRQSSQFKELFGLKIRVLSIDGLIKAKRAAGRPKDLLVLPELEALKEALSDDEE